MIPVENGVSAELPRYKCHKEVWALKIKAVQLHKPTIYELEKILNSGARFPAATITPDESGYAAFDVDQDYVTKHQPEAGGYYVVYKDGYQSYSPAKAFDEGYSRA